MNFLTKKCVSRRRVLQGLGVGVALPFLDAMVPAAAAVQPRPKLKAGQAIPYDRYKQPMAELKLLTVLDRAAGKLEGRFANQPTSASC